MRVDSETAHRRLVMTFPFEVLDVMEAINEKTRYHQGRLAHWRVQFDKVRQRAPEAVIVQEAAEVIVDPDIDTAFDGAAFSTLRASYAGHAPMVQVDPSLERDLQAAMGKVQEHNSKVEQYQRYYRLFERLAGTATAVVELTVGDAEFFGL